MTVSWLGASALAVFTLAAWLGRLHPILELLPNARVQVMMVAAVAALAWAVADRRGPALVAVAVVAVNAVHVFPYAFDDPDPRPAGAVPVRAMQYNIYYGNDELDAVADHILEADADIVALHEILPDGWFLLLEGRLSETYPHRIAAPFDEFEGQLSGGMALLSKTPLDPQWVDGRASPPDRVLLAATTEVAGRPVMVIGLHPHASRFESRKVALRGAQIDAVVELASRTDGPVIVLSDLNVTPTSPVYRDLLDDLGWRDPHRIAGWDTTWPTWGGPLGFPIDHVLVSDHFAIHASRTGDGAGSDHRSLVVDLSLR